VIPPARAVSCHTLPMSMKLMELELTQDQAETMLMLAVLEIDVYVSPVPHITRSGWPGTPPMKFVMPIAEVLAVTQFAYSEIVGVAVATGKVCVPAIIESSSDRS